MPRQFSRREKYAIYGVSGSICLMLLIGLIISPLLNAHRDRSGKLATRTADREDILNMKSEYEEAKRRASASARHVAGRKANFRLFSFLEGLAGDGKIKEHISYMKPSTSKPKGSPYTMSQVEMKLQNITMEQLAAYLHKVETSRNMVFVKRLSVSKDSKQEGSINAILQVETPAA